MDRLTKEQRHKNMVGNKSRGTQIELLLGKMLWNAGIRYRKNDASLPGTPDFSIRSAHVAVFCDGEFWHGHNWDERKHDIKTNRDFWYAKIERNIRRDALVNQQLEVMGWKVFRFWENDIRREPERCLGDVLDYIHVMKNDRSSFYDTYGTAADAVILYGRHSYNRDGSIMPVNDQMAVITHYLNNTKARHAAPYCDEGEGLLRDIAEDGDAGDVVSEEDVRHTLLKYTFKARFVPREEPCFTFVDLFSGIGGMSLGLLQAGGTCVFASEWDALAVKQYFNNFGIAPFGDITKEETKIYVPTYADVLAASLPVQAFALQGRRNIEDKIRGTLFSATADVIRRCHPSAVWLEFPVKQMTLGHNLYFNIIIETLNNLQYTVTEPLVLNASHYGHALDREYLYVIAFSDCRCAERFNPPAPSACSICFADIQENDAVSARYYIRQSAAHKAAQSAGIVHSVDKIRLCPGTLVTDMRTVEILPHTRRLDQLNREGLRRITEREMMRLMGFPDDYIITSSYNDLRRMISVTSPVKMAGTLAAKIAEALKETKAVKRYPNIKKA